MTIWDLFQVFAKYYEYKIIIIINIKILVNLADRKGHILCFVFFFYAVNSAILLIKKRPKIETS